MLELHHTGISNVLRTSNQWHFQTLIVINDYPHHETCMRINIAGHFEHPRGSFIFSLEIRKENTGNKAFCHQFDHIGDSKETGDCKSN